MKSWRRSESVVFLLLYVCSVLPRTASRCSMSGLPSRMKKKILKQPAQVYDIPPNHDPVQGLHIALETGNRLRVTWMNPVPPHSTHLAPVCYYWPRKPRVEQHTETTGSAEKRDDTDNKKQIFKKTKNKPPETRKEEMHYNNKRLPKPGENKHNSFTSIQDKEGFRNETQANVSQVRTPARLFDWNKPFVNNSTKNITGQVQASSSTDKTKRKESLAHTFKQLSTATRNETRENRFNPIHNKENKNLVPDSSPGSIKERNENQMRTFTSTVDKANDTVHEFTSVDDNEINDTIDQSNKSQVHELVGDNEINNTHGIIFTATNDDKINETICTDKVNDTKPQASTTKDTYKTEGSNTQERTSSVSADSRKSSFVKLNIVTISVRGADIGKHVSEDISVQHHGSKCTSSQHHAPELVSTQYLPSWLSSSRRLASTSHKTGHLSKGGQPVNRHRFSHAHTQVGSNRFSSSAVKTRAPNPNYIKKNQKYIKQNFRIQIRRSRKQYSFWKHHTKVHSWAQSSAFLFRHVRTSDVLTESGYAKNYNSPTPHSFSSLSLRHRYGSQQVHPRKRTAFIDSKIGKVCAPRKSQYNQNIAPLVRTYRQLAVSNRRRVQTGRITVLDSHKIIDMHGQDVNSNGGLPFLYRNDASPHIPFVKHSIKSHHSRRKRDTHDHVSEKKNNDKQHSSIKQHHTNQIANNRQAHKHVPIKSFMKQIKRYVKNSQSTSNNQYHTADFRHEAKGQAYSYTEGGFSHTLNYAILDLNLISCLPKSEPCARSFSYQCGDAAWGFSEVQQVSFQSERALLSPQHQIAIVGDLSIPQGQKTIDSITARIHDNSSVSQVAMLLHLGDISYADNYNTQTGNNSYIWVDYMNSLQSAVARVPYMTAPGNHEKQFDFAAYRNWLPMPYNASQSSSPYWFSFDYLGVHVVSLSTEHDFGHQSAQRAWMEEDLKRANENRVQVPWVIMIGHRPLYCTSILCKSRCHHKAKRYRRHLEKILQEQRVDVVLAGNNHQYERSFPVYQGKTSQKNYTNPTAPVYIVNGAAGNPGILDPTFQPAINWRAWCDPSMTTSFLLMTPSATQLTFDYVRSDTNDVIDSFTIIKQ